MVRLAVLSMVAGQAVMSLLMVITPVHMDRHGQGTGEISLVIMAHTLGMFGLSGVTGWLIDRFGRMVMIGAGALVLLSACVMAPGAQSVPSLALALFLLGLGWNFCFVSGSSLLSEQLMAHERGRAQGAGEVLVALGAGAGTLGSGLLYNRGNILVVSIIGSLMVLVLLGVLLLTVIPNRPAKALSTSHD
jgi:MFS family permease